MVTSAVLPDRETLLSRKSEAEARIREIHIKCFPGYDRPVFLISNAYPGVWLEHAFDAVAYARLTEDGKRVLWGQMHLFLDRQKEDGQLPCFVLDAENPHTKKYGRLVGYGQIQECVSFASLCLEAADMLGDEAFLAEAYEKCAKWEAWLVRNRMTTGKGLIETFCTFDTGHDNSSRLEGIPGGCPDGDAKNMNALEFLPLYSPDMNAVFFGTRAALSQMAKRLGKRSDSQMWAEKAEEIRKRIGDVLFDPEEEFFFDVDRFGNRRKRFSIAAMTVFQEHAADRALFERVYKRHFRNPDEFWTEYPFPSLSKADKMFEKRKPGNDWGYYSQALTALRAMRWMDFYGVGGDLTELYRRWVTGLANAKENVFSQELDPLTGEASCSSRGYSSALLLYLHGLKRLGIG